MNDGSIAVHHVNCDTSRFNLSPHPNLTFLILKFCIQMINKVRLSETVETYPTLTSTLWKEEENAFRLPELGVQWQAIQQ